MGGYRGYDEMKGRPIHKVDLHEVYLSSGINWSHRGPRRMRR
jgi:hypothetical protein